jgi:hypothetical protein
MSGLEGRRNYRCMCRIVERKEISRGITTNPKRKRRLECVKRLRFTNSHLILVGERLGGHDFLSQSDQISS